MRCSSARLILRRTQPEWLTSLSRSPKLFLLYSHRISHSKDDATNKRHIGNHDTSQQNPRCNIPPAPSQRKLLYSYLQHLSHFERVSYSIGRFLFCVQNFETCPPAPALPAANAYAKTSWVWFHITIAETWTRGLDKIDSRWCGLGLVREGRGGKVVWCGVGLGRGKG
jgi:hypothetical protein